MTSKTRDLIKNAVTSALNTHFMPDFRNVAKLKK
jgi:hypothetical protein